MSNEITSVGRQPVPAPQEAAAVRAVKPAPTPAPEEKASQAKAVDQAALRAQSETARKELQQAMEQLNEQAKKNSFNLNFSFDQASQHVVVRVKDAHSGEVVRQIPDETVLRLASHLEDIKGVLQDKKI